MPHLKEVNHITLCLREKSDRAVVLVRHRDRMRIANQSNRRRALRRPRPVYEDLVYRLPRVWYCSDRGHRPGQEVVAHQVFRASWRSFVPARGT